MTFLDFWEKLKIWPFSPIFGQKWPILPKMAYFGYFSKTAHQILIIFCIKMSDIVRNWKLLFGTLGKLLFWKFWPFFGQFCSGGRKKKFCTFFLKPKLKLCYFGRNFFFSLNPLDSRLSQNFDQKLRNGSFWHFR